MSISFKKTVVFGSAFLALSAVALAPIPDARVISRAYAGDGSGPKGPAGSTGQQGQAGSGDNRGTIGGRGSGQGGPSSESTSKGPRYGGGENANKPSEGRGSPSWSHDTLPEDVTLGRLSVARAPAHVLDKALIEAISTMDFALYKLTSLSDVLAAINSGTISGEVFTRVDSPLQNLALYKDLLIQGWIGDGTTKLPVSTSSTELLLAVFLGSAADKTIPITADTVTAIDTILQVKLPDGVSVTQLAADADAVRQAILAAHEGE